MKKLSKLTLISMLAFGLGFCGCSANIPAENGSETTGTTTATEKKAPEKIWKDTNLHEAYADYFDIGVALSANSYNKYYNGVYENFSTITAENEMKWESIEKTEGNFTFENADILANFARDNGKKMRGHTLVWHLQTPSWVTEVPENTSVDDTIIIMLERIEKHFVALNERYSDVITDWDVVNEVISDVSGEMYHKDSIYYKACGSDNEKFEYFISEVYKIVQKVNPDVVCYYNDYNLEWNKEKRDKAIKFVENVEAYGVDIHAIGFQGHNDINMNYDTYCTAINDMKNSGLFTEMAVTEIDLSIYTSASQENILLLDDETEKKQAEAYASVFKAFREHSDFIANITFWGISDATTWLDYFPTKSRNNHPLLFDDYGEKKLAFDAILDF